MTIRIDGIVHRVTHILLYDFVARESFFCCTPERVCNEHAVKVGWIISTGCEIEMSIRGRPKKGTVTCLACLAIA